MGYSKYNEDIYERRLDDLSSMYPHYYGPHANIEAVISGKQKPATSGDVRVWMGQRPLEDHLALPVNVRVPLRCITSPADLPWTAHLLDTAGRQVEVFGSPQFDLTITTSGRYVLRVECGLYHKQYRLDFLPPHNIEDLPDLQAELTQFLSHPPAWTRQSFDCLRARLDAMVVAGRLPDAFVSGLLEYFQGLYLEANRDGSFGKRFEAAFSRLAPYRSHSRLAESICNYCLYRFNLFAPLLNMDAMSRWNRIGRFFCEPCDALSFSNAAGGSADPAPSGRALEMVIASHDMYLWSALDAVVRKDWDLARLTLSDMRAKSTRIPSDDQSRQREDFVEARLGRLSGNIAGARTLYATLVISGCAFIRKEAERYMQLDHGVDVS